MSHYHELATAELISEEMGQLLERARAIDSGETGGSSVGGVESFLKAGEELGIRREALVQALRERLGHPACGFTVGDRVFARSADEAFYVAVITELDQGSAVVRFVNGGDHRVDLADLRAFRAIPGAKVMANWPFWGWWHCDVISYDAGTDTFTVTDGMSQKRFGLKDIRLAPEKPKRPRSLSSLLWRLALISGGAGAALGFLAVRLFA